MKRRGEQYLTSYLEVSSEAGIFVYELEVVQELTREGAELVVMWDSSAKLRGVHHVFEAGSGTLPLAHTSVIVCEVWIAVFGKETRTALRRHGHLRQ